SDGDLDLVPDDADGIRPDPVSGAVEPPAVGQAEPPAMPGAGDGLVEDDAVTERRPLVGTGVVDGVIRALVADDGDRPPLDHARQAAPFGDLADARDGVKGSGIQVTVPRFTRRGGPRRLGMGRTPCGPRRRGP